MKPGLIAALSIVVFAQTAAGLVPARAGDAPAPVLSEDGRTLAYTYCSEDEAAECIAYSLDCRGDTTYGDHLRITIMGNTEEGRDVRAIARLLLERDFGQMTARFRLGKGEPLDLMLTAFGVSQNEMDGDWELDLHSYQQNMFLEALDESSAGSVTLQVEDHSMVLSDNAKAAERLLRFKQACTN